MPKPPHVWTYANRYPAQDAFAALVRSEPSIRQSDAVRRLGYRREADESPSDASCTVTETMAPVSRSTPCSAL